MAEVLKKFGRYFLLDHLAQGGMAEIYRARLASSDGAGRIIVIKKVIAGFGNNADFLSMFKSEIQVTMGFNHPNIVQVYDFGEEENQPYIAMEWVDGKNLKQFLNRFAELKKPFPIELATHIIEQSAAGLHYAHSYRDKVSGNPLNIVHRDISPQNLLISYEGTPKVIDFGIAKATTNQEATQAGVIKGKPSYLSPEQISGEALDGRSDVFALGAVLWEVLTGRKLFAGDNDLAVLKMIEACQTHVKPPSTLNPKVPKELDYIVLRSLAKQREKRFQSAEEMQRALHKFLYNYYPEFNPTDLSYYARDLFKNEIVEDRKRILKLSEKAEQVLANLKSSESTQARAVSSQISPPKQPASAPLNQSPTQGTSSPPVSPLSHSQVEFQDPSQAPVIELSPATILPDQGTVLTQQKRPTHSPRLDSVAITSKALPSSGNTAAHIQGTQPSSRLTAPILRAPQAQSLQKTDLLRSKGWWFIAVACLLLISWLGPQYGFEVPILSGLLGTQAQRGNDQRRVGSTSSNQSPQTIPNIPGGSGKSILLKIHLALGGGSGPTIKLNSTDLNSEYPLVYAPLDLPLELTIEKEGFKPYRSEFVLDSTQLNGLKEWQVEVKLEPLHGGFLTLHSTPNAIATIMIDGVAWKKETPIEREKLPVGHYEIHLENTVLGMEKKVPLDIVEDQYEIQEVRLDLKNQ
jgi:serine/threonine protein kinase